MPSQRLTHLFLFPSPELHLAREMLMQKFGRPFALSVVNNDPPCVPTRVSSKLAIYVPPEELVDMYLQEIARGYGINWTSDRIKPDEEESKGAETTAVEDGSEETDADKVSHFERSVLERLINAHLRISGRQGKDDHPVRETIRYPQPTTQEGPGPTQSGRRFRGISSEV